MYRLFAAAVASEIPLPGIPPARAPAADIEVVRGRGAALDITGVPLHTWRGPCGEPLLACSRPIGGGYLLHFPDLADFAIAGDVITCHPGPRCRDATLRHLLLDQVIPRLLAHRGALVLHASAVQRPGGGVIAFAGESGWGKSTLAAALAVRGCRLLGDDSATLRACQGEVRLTPGYTGLRLNGDSIATLGRQGERWTAVAGARGKRQWLPAEGAAAGPLQLETLYLLARPGSVPAPVITPLPGAEALAKLLARSFVLDVRDRRSAAFQLREAAAVLSALPAVRALDYPRDYRALPALCDLLLAGARATA
jgi:hypothetical protein